MVWKAVVFLGGARVVWEQELTMPDVAGLEADGEAWMRVEVVGDLGDLGGDSVMKIRVSHVRSSTRPILR